MRNTVWLATVAPHGMAEVKVTVVTSRDENYFSRKPLLWAGQATDASGKSAEFVVKRRRGGAR